MHNFTSPSLKALVICSLHLCAAAETTGSFFDLALKEVLELEVTSVSKKPQTVSRAAAAVFVITSDDIKRSAAQSIPDALRLAPGVQVAQISANSWAITARGPNGRFANKLLVMIDGRTVYSPMFSGVFWDSQDTVLADIERIEVIRGPGAALWGANAVNGVINIITKSAAATQGILIETSVGTQTQGNVSMRYGSQIEGLGNWRMYGKAFENKPLDLADGLGKGMDGWRQQRMGLRADLNPSAQDAVTLQTEIHQGSYGESSQLNTTTPPAYTVQGTSQVDMGNHFLARWQRDLADNNSLTLQSYYDHTRRDWPAHPYFQVDTWDFDAQYRHRAINSHDIVLGASFRQYSDHIQTSTADIPTNTVQYATMTVPEQSSRMWSVLAQDDISLVPNEWILTLGNKFEKYQAESVKPLPNIRLLWTPNDNQTLWSAISKAIRTPSRADRDGTITSLMPSDYKFNGATLPRPSFINISGQTTSEELWAYEIGWKQRFAPGLTLDTSAYYNDYTKLRSASTTDLVCKPSLNLYDCYGPSQPNQYFDLPTTLSNEYAGYSAGLESSLDWKISRQHRLQTSVTYYVMKLMTSLTNVYPLESPYSSPHWSGSAHWSYTPNKQIEIDIIVRHVGSLNNEPIDLSSIPSYTTTDIRWAWHSAPSVQWSVTGRNLFMSHHLEFTSEISDVARTLIGPSVVLGLQVKY
jgi:iron complex outermembrane receptor protein